MASAWVGLTLPGMIEEPGSFSGSEISPMPERGPEPMQANVVGDLEQPGGEARERALREHERVVGGERLELVRRRGEGEGGQLRDLRGEGLGEERMRVEPGPDCGAALRQRKKPGKRRRDARDPERHLRGIAGEFLAERHRRRVLEMGAADLDDVGEGFRLVVEGAVKVAQRRQQARFDLARRGDVHGGREGVVRRLAAVDVIVRVHRRFAAALAAERLVGEARDDLVGVHVRLGAGAGLPDDERELVVVLALHHLGGRGGDRVGDPRLELAEVLVDERPPPA